MIRNFHQRPVRCESWNGAAGRRVKVASIPPLAAIAAPAIRASAALPRWLPAARPQA